MKVKGFRRIGVRRAWLLLRVSFFPAIMHFLATTAFSATLEWDPNTETDLAGYRVYYGPVSRSYTNVLEVGNVTSNTLSGLVSGAQYFFAVTAYNIYGDESDFSNEVAFTVPDPINVPPTLDPIGDVMLDEDAPTRVLILTGISAGASNEIQTLTVAAVSNNPTLIPDPIVSNSSPDPVGTLSQTLTLTAVSDNPTLLPNPSVNYISGNATATLQFAPLPDANGSATITVTVDDGGQTNNLVSRSFTVLVNPINDPPALDSISNVTVDQGTVHIALLTGIHAGAPNESDALVITATSSNTNVVSAPTIAYSSPNNSGTLSFTALSNGTATITLAINDSQATNNSTLRSFLVTVRTNEAPVISRIADQLIQKNASTGLLPFTIGDRETPATNLSLTATTSNTNLILLSRITFDGFGSNRTVAVVPEKGRTGVALITIRVSDGTNQTSTTFLVNVAANLVKAPSEGQPVVVSISHSAASRTRLEWNSIIGNTYRVMRKEALNAADWEEASGDIKAVGPTTAWVDSIIRVGTSYFYRVMLLLPAEP
jgi:hypothetical protein